MISVILPTIDGREKSLARAIRSLTDFQPEGHEYEWLIYDNRPTCNIAWNEGAQRAIGDYVLFFADDLEAHADWGEAGITWVDSGYLPCARILNSDGSLQSCGDDVSEQATGASSQVARIPFCSQRQMQAIFPVLETQYMGDYHFSHKGAQQGWPTVVVRDFLFTHHSVLEGRLDTLSADLDEYWRVTR